MTGADAGRTMASMLPNDGTRSLYQTYTDQQLLLLKAQFAPATGQHQVAAEVLAVRQAEREATQRDEALSRYQALLSVGTRTLHWTVVSAIAAVVAAFVGLAGAAVALWSCRAK